MTVEKKWGKLRVSGCPLDIPLFNEIIIWGIFQYRIIVLFDIRLLSSTLFSIKKSESLCSRKTEIAEVRILTGCSAPASALHSTVRPHLILVWKPHRLLSEGRPGSGLAAEWRLRARPVYGAKLGLRTEPRYSWSLYYSPTTTTPPTLTPAITPWSLVCSTLSLLSQSRSENCFPNQGRARSPA